jgi:hypothetical protein
LGDLPSPQSPLGMVDGQAAKLGDGVFLLFDALLRLIQAEVIDNRHVRRILQKGVSKGVSVDV